MKSDTESFQEVAKMLISAGELAGKANSALDPAVKGVGGLSAALDEVDSFVSFLNNLDEVVTMTESAFSLASSVLEELGVGEILDAMATALKGIQKAYKVPLKDIAKVDKDTVKKVKPEIDKIHKALQTAQKDLTFAHEKLPQYAMTVEIVEALMQLLGAVISAFPNEHGDSSPSGRLKALLFKWNEICQTVQRQCEKVIGGLDGIKDTVAKDLAPVGDVFKDAEKAVKAVTQPLQNLISTMNPWAEKLRHATSNIKALKWLAKAMKWLGKAIDWMLDKISLGKLFEWLGKKGLDPLLHKLHLDGIAEKIKSGLPNMGNLENSLDLLTSTPERIKDLKSTLSQFKTGQDGDPMIPLIQAVLDAVTGTKPTDFPDLPPWTPPPTVKEETAKAAVANRMKYVSQYERRSVLYTACFSALKKLTNIQSGGIAHPGETIIPASPGDFEAEFPPASPPGPGWAGLTHVRNAVTKAKSAVSPGTTEIKYLEDSLTAFDEQVALAPLLEEDLANLSEIWTACADILVKVERIAAKTVLADVLKGFGQAALDQAGAVQKLSGEAQRFRKNATFLNGIVAQTYAVLRKRFRNAPSNNGGTFVNALIAWYSNLDLQINTLPRAFKQLSRADKGKKYADRIAAVRKEMNTAGEQLVVSITTTTTQAAKIQQAISKLITEIKSYGARAGVMADQVKQVRNHQYALHTLSHYLGVADSILDPLSWLLNTYVCKDQEQFSDIQEIVSRVHTWGKNQVGNWLKDGVRNAVDALAEAETHISAATVSLQGSNNELENGGLKRAQRAACDIETALSELDKELALRHPDTDTDWLTQTVNQQLVNLANEILGR